MLKENLNSHRYVLAKIPSEKYEKWTVKYPSRWNTRKNSNQTKRNINKWHINLNNIHLSVSFLAFYTFLQVFCSWGCSIPINGENMLIGTASQLEQTATWIHIRSVWSVFCMKSPIHHLKLNGGLIMLSWYLSDVRGTGSFNLHLIKFKEQYIKVISFSETITNVIRWR